MNDRIPRAAADPARRFTDEQPSPGDPRNARPVAHRTFRHAVSLLHLPEPRGAVRLDCQVPITVQAVAMRMPCRGRGEVVNLSQHGLGLRTGRTFHVGQFLAITFPSARPFPPPLVMRVIHRRHLPDGRHFLGGVWMRQLSPQQLDALLC
jgi:hypothetical protein